MAESKLPPPVFALAYVMCENSTVRHVFPACLTLGGGASSLFARQGGTIPRIMAGVFISTPGEDTVMIAKGGLAGWAERSALRRAGCLTTGRPVPGRLRFVFYGRVSTVWGSEMRFRVFCGQSGSDVALVGKSAEDLLATDPVLGEVDRFRRVGAALSWCELVEG